MTEERLKEIKDSIEFQKNITMIRDYDRTFINEEIELYNEVVRLREENEKIKKMNMHEHQYGSDMEEKYLIEKEKNEMAISLCNEYLYHDDVCGNEKNINYEELKNVLKGNNLTLEQLTGVENE